jgi:hypothetical protein
MMNIHDMNEDEDIFFPDDLPMLLLEIPESALGQAAVPLREGAWRQSGVFGLWYRLDPAREDMKQKRHVHVAATKHIKNSDKQAAWNDDGSRHDRKRFNGKLGSQASYRNLARAALGLGDDIILEEFTPDHPQQLILLTEAEAAEARVVFLRWAGPHDDDGDINDLLGTKIRMGL